MRRTSPLWLIAALACSRETDERGPRVLTPTGGDSAGWHAVAVPALGLELRYPASHVRAVLDRSTRACTTVPSLPGEPWDSVGADTLVVANAPSSFDSIAIAMGFDVKPNGYWHREDTLHGTAWAGVDSLRVGPWRVLTARAENAIYFDDMTYEPEPGDPPDARMPPDPVWQERFVAVAPAGDRCAIVLAWRGHVVRASKEGYEAGKWPPELLRAFLERATITSKPGGERSRQ